MPSWDDIKNKVEAHDNILTTIMSDLKDAIGKEKLGTHVRNEISKTLAGMGLGHIPQVLPSYQHESVRLYKRGTAVGDLIEMVLTPSELNDRKLKEQLSKDGVKYITIIEQIRELVAE